MQAETGRPAGPAVYSMSEQADIGRPAAHAVYPVPEQTVMHAG